MRVAKESWPFVLPLVLLTVLLAGLGLSVWAAAMALLSIAVLLFFRVPPRQLDADEGSVLSPADGKILKIDHLEAPDIGDGSYQRVVIFLSVFNVHVQRAPVGGKVAESRYRAGRKLAAFDDRAGDVNEQQLTVLETPRGHRVGIRQIAGLLARRVVSYLSPGQAVRQGELIGVIKFGSRVDLLLPVGYDLKVNVGDRVREGLTIMATPTEEKPS